VLGVEIMPEKKCIYCDNYGDCKLVSSIDVATPCTICEEYEEEEDD
jgi:hypothetical protein